MVERYSGPTTTTVRLKAGRQSSPDVIQNDCSVGRLDGRKTREITVIDDEFVADWNGRDGVSD